MLMSKPAIEKALDDGEIVIENLKRDNLEPASYDARIGTEAIVTREVQLEDLKERVEMGTAEKIDIEAENSIEVPAGGLALVTTLEKFSLSNKYAGHIGMKSYYVRKGLGLLSGMQIDPGFGNPPAVLVLALKNQSTRTVTLDYKDELCTVEFHELSEPAPEYDNPDIEDAQREGGIPKGDVDYLRTIEAMSVSEMTEAMLSMSRTVEENNKWLKYIGVLVGAGLILLMFRLALTI